MYSIRLSFITLLTLLLLPLLLFAQDNQSDDDTDSTRTVQTESSSEVASDTSTTTTVEAEIEVGVQNDAPQTRDENTNDEDVTSSEEDRANYNNSRSNRATIRQPAETVAEPETAIRSSGDTDQDGHVDVMEGANYNNSRSNRSTAADVDTETCDGYLCGDGECVATASQCLEDSVGNAQNHNSSRSNETEGVANPNVCDGVTCQDGSCAPTEQACTAPDRVDWATALRNGPPDPLDDDSDDDGLLDTETDDRLNDIADKMRSVRVNTRIEETTGERKMSAVAVAARELRNWNDEDIEAFRHFKATVASNTPEHAGLRATEIALEDEKITELSGDEDSAEMSYRAEMRLFGLIPLEREVRASAMSGGEVTINYPWYSFLASKPNTEKIRNTLLDTLSLFN